MANRCSSVRWGAVLTYPGPVDRYRCTACGNLTRFDVTRTRRTHAFHHYTVGGELSMEDEVILSDVVECVACRWCGTGASVEVVTTEVVRDSAPDAPRYAAGDAVDASVGGVAVETGGGPPVEAS